MARPAPHAWSVALAPLFLAAGGLVACDGGLSTDDQARAAPPSILSPLAARSPPTSPGACRRWTTCQPGNPCRIGLVTGCDRGEPVCTELGWLSNGTSCGADAVCYLGECLPCAAGELCTATDDWGNELVCQVGTITCATGLPTCEGVATAPDGYSCWGNDQYVCDDGVCTWCVDGLTACTLADAPCHVAVMDACQTTGGTCTDNGTFLPDGSWCGADGYCAGGECEDCGWYQPCEAPSGSCWYGYQTCETGAPVCHDNYMVPDGTPCDEGGTCSFGACVASVRQVTGTALTTFWPDGGPEWPFRDVQVDLIGAYKVHPWGTQYFFHWADEDGAFVIADVPVGPITLLVQAPDGPHAFETAADFVDLGVDVLGRPDVALADLPTPVTFDVDGLEPVASPTVLFAASNAGVAISAPVPGPVDWGAAWRPLVDTSRGDVAWMVQNVVAADPAIPATVTATRRCLPTALPDLMMVAGEPATVAATLEPCPETGSVTADWRISLFESFLPQVHPDAAVGNSRIAFLTRPHASPFAPGFRTGFIQGINGIPLLLVGAAAGAGDLAIPGVEFGLAVPPGWSAWRHDRTRFSIPFTAPGAAAPLNFGVNIGADVAAAATPELIEPVISPPRNLKIAGQDAWAWGLQWVIDDPTLSWDPPELIPEGRLPIYDVTVYRLDVTAAGGTSLAPVFFGRTGSTALRVTSGLECCSFHYVAMVNATVSDESLDAPFRRSVEFAYAAVVSRDFAPYYWW